jgi:hypothetical protein
VERVDLPRASAIREDVVRDNDTGGENRDTARDGPEVKIVDGQHATAAMHVTGSPTCLRSPAEYIYKLLIQGALVPETSQDGHDLIYHLIRTKRTRHSSEVNLGGSSGIPPRCRNLEEFRDTSEIRAQRE